MNGMVLAGGTLLKHKLVKLKKAKIKAMKSTIPTFTVRPIFFIFGQKITLCTSKHVAKRNIGQNVFLSKIEMGAISGTPCTCTGGG